MAPPGQLLPLARSLLPLSAPPFVSGRRRRLPTLVLGRALPPPTWLPHGRLPPAHPLPFAPPRRLSRPPPPATSLPGASPGGGAEAQAVLAEFVTSERVKVAAMLGLALALCNADRVVMSVAIVPLSQAYGWTPSFAGVVQSSFLWGYLVSPIIGGALVDYYGGKRVMAYGVALWSLATFLSPWAAARSLWLFLSTRVLLGMAEGVALPSMNNMVLRWFPRTERSSAVGIAMAGFQLGNTIGLLLSPIIMSRAGIFGPFVIFGLFGFLWVLVWISAISGTPGENAQISAHELDYITRGQKLVKTQSGGERLRKVPPFSKLLSKWPTWALISANAMHSWGYFVILSWMPVYFKTIYHVNLREAAWFSALPWVMMAVLGYVAGVVSDRLIQNGTSITLTRKIMQTIGFVGPGVALLGLNAAKSPVIASAWLTIAVGLKSFGHSGFLVNLQEIAPQYAGVLHGMSNTAGTFAAILGTVGAGFFVDRMGSFRGFLILTSLLYFSSTLFWDIFATGERVDFDGTG
uniref:Major facilitator superfamily (MFS) profile domain-containing protein n=2 Tax=Oryza TaxID=4527 RepID=A0A0E0FVU5_ORYNI